MRLIKRLLAVVLGAALLCPMTAYAAQSQEALELYKAVEAKNQNMTDMNAFYDFKMKMTGRACHHTSTSPKSVHQYHFAYKAYCKLPMWKVCFHPVHPAKECAAVGDHQTRDVHF